MATAYHLQRHQLEEASRLTEMMISRAIQMTTKALPSGGTQFDTDMLAAVVQALAINYATVNRTHEHEAHSVY